MKAMMGTPGAPSRTPMRAPRISWMSNIVSMAIRSTPASARMEACSRKIPTASSKVVSPKGAMVEPKGPMSPAI